MSIIYDSETMKELVGFEIIHPIIEPDGPDNEGYFGFKVKKGKVEKIVWILMDPEGNGPGCLDVVNL